MAAVRPSRQWASVVAVCVGFVCPLSSHPEPLIHASAASAFGGVITRPSNKTSQILHTPASLADNEVLTAPSNEMAIATVAFVIAASQQQIPCVSVQNAGMTEANGLYASEELPSYVGPLAYHKPKTDLWIYRWHQTFWYMSRLTFPLLDEESFTRPVIYTVMAGWPPASLPPQAGWTYAAHRTQTNRNIPPLSCSLPEIVLSSRSGDVMNGYGPSPFPTLEMATCRTGPDGNLELDRAQAITPPQAVTSWVEGSLRPWASKGVNEAEAVGVEDNEVYEPAATDAETHRRSRIVHGTSVAVILCMLLLLRISYRLGAACCRTKRKRMRFCPAPLYTTPLVLKDGSVVIVPIATAV